MNSHKPEFLSYSPLLSKHQIQFIEANSWLIVGESKINNQWILFVTVRINQAIALLDMLLPILAGYKVSFRLIKDQLTHCNLNAGTLGFIEVGKFLSIYSTNQQSAVELVSKLLPITELFSGPQVPGALRLGKTLFAFQAEWTSTVAQNKETITLKLFLPKSSTIPFSINKKYKPHRKRNIIGKYYILLELIRSSPKGDIHKALNIKHLSLRPCLIKEGKEAVLDDLQGRDIRTRLLWQQYVLFDIGHKIPTAKVLDYFEIAEDGFLVMEFIEGDYLARKLSSLRKGAKWNCLQLHVQLEIIAYYQQILTIIQTMHNAGYVHRDIQDNNFIVTPNNQVYILDFELSFCPAIEQPLPPFTLGTFGYASPEQIAGITPTPKADIYSLGALLCFFITGTHPNIFLEEGIETAHSKLWEHIESSEIVGLICSCLEPIPEHRPDITSIVKLLSEYYSSLHCGFQNTTYHKLLSA
jgi:serine/threonine protein kinase